MALMAVAFAALVAACGPVSEKVRCDDDSQCTTGEYCRVFRDAAHGTCSSTGEPDGIFTDPARLSCLHACDNLAACWSQGDCEGGSRKTFAGQCAGLCGDAASRALVQSHATDACYDFYSRGSTIFEGWNCNLYDYDDEWSEPDEQCFFPYDEDGYFGHRFVLLEDLSTDGPNGDSPGADIDAIAIDKDGFEVYANSVEDFNIGGANNSFADTNELLGAPDSGCEKKNFTALGGAANDGYVIVSFEYDETIESGDNIVVYELGPTVCTNQPISKDDETRVSISTLNSIDGDWEVIGSTGAGQYSIPVP